MAEEPREPAQPLDYVIREWRPPARSVIVAGIGAVIALIGMIVFFAAHAISLPASGVQYHAEDQRLDELLWAFFGIALLLAGALIAAIGLWAWCRDDAG